MCVGDIPWMSVEAHLLCSEMQVFQDSIHSLRHAKDLKTWNMFHTSSTEIER
jgi:hypothetical protein